KGDPINDLDRSTLPVTGNGKPDSKKMPIAEQFAMNTSTSSRRRALITGITGQDGSYLAELLLEKGYDVHGVIRRSSSFNTGRIDHLYRDPRDPENRLHLHYGDLNDASSLNRLLRIVDPDEIYNLGAQ